MYLGTTGGKQKNTMFNIKGVIAFCMLSNQKEAITFQRWADSVLEREITNINDENTSDIRIIAKKKRLEFTDTLKEHGYKSPHEYIQTTKQMKEGLGIDGKKKKAECDDIEVMKIQTAEMLARTKIMIENANGYKSVNPLCVESSKIINQNTQRQLSN
jgi:ribosomal protein S8